MVPLLASLLAVSAAVSTVNAMPWRNWNGGYWNPSRDSTPTIPLYDDPAATALPKPTSPAKYITLGLGFQNYTCNNAGAYVQTVLGSGAVATLYDISKLITPITGDSYTRTTLQAFQLCLATTFCSPSPQNDYCGACHSIAAAAFLLGQEGYHFFAPINGGQVPNFNLYRGGDFLSAKRIAGVPAPANAYDGQNNLGAVQWLYLADNGDGLTHGLQGVYRIETAGGVAPSSCKPGQQTQIPYAAEYWFFD